MGEVKKFYTAASPDHVLELAIGEFSEVLIIGFDHNGVIDVRSNTTMDKMTAVFLMEQFKTKLLNGDYDVPEEK